MRRYSESHGWRRARPPHRRNRGAISDPISRAMKRIDLERRRQDQARFERAAGEAVVL